MKAIGAFLAPLKQLRDPVFGGWLIPLAVFLIVACSNSAAAEFLRLWAALHNLDPRR